MEIIKLSQFTSNIKYIPLETSDEVLINRVTYFDISDDKILTTDNNTLFLFDLKGRLITKFGSKGRGPGEYLSIRNLNIIKSNKINFRSLYDLFEFDINGNFINKYVNIFRMNSYFFSEYYQINDSLFFGNIPNTTGKNEYKASIVNKQGKVEQTYKNYILFDHEKGRGFRTEDGFASFNVYKDEILYKCGYNDTLFQLGDKFQIKPKYVLDFGKYADPLSQRRKSLAEWDPKQYIYLNEFFQTEKYLFLVCNFGNYFPAKRLSPKKLSLPGGEVVDSWFIEGRALGIYEKKTKNLSFCKPTSTDDPLFATGFYNDFDAGPRFLPEKMINDSTMVMWVGAKELIDYVTSDNFKNIIPKFPEKKKQLEELSKRVNVFDNPILMIVTFQK